MRRYDPVGVCIYCGATTDLRDEHIIPRALDGDWILPEASCRACEAITSRFERRVLKGPLWLPRLALGLRTRRPKAQPTTFPIEVTINNTKEVRDIPIDANLPSVVLPMFATPGFMRGDNIEEGIKTEGLYVGHLNRTPEQVAKSLGVDRIALQMEYPVIEFARLIGKIGYGYAIAELGLNNVISPLVLPAIRGLTQDIGHWVGTVSDVKPAPDNDTLHIANVFSKNGMVLVGLSLFALQPAPIYMVLVSKGQRDEEIREDVKGPWGGGFPRSDRTLAGAWEGTDERRGEE